MRRIALGLVLSLLAFAQVARADPYVRQPGIDALHYAFRLTLSDSTDQILGEATVDVRFVKDNVAEFWLDLATPADGKGMTVSDVLSGGAALRFTHAAGRLRIFLTAPPKVGEHRQFTVRYRGVPAAGLRIIKNKFGERCFFSENWSERARQWLPMIDHPSDKATSEFLITAPSRYQVVANGLLQEETDLGDGRRLTHWKQSVPIASWLNAIGVAQFAVHHAGLVKGVELQSWVYRQERDAGFAWFESTATRSLEFFSDYVGPYSYEKLANVEAAGFGGGTEHASAIFYGENSIISRPASGLVAHEIAHQWFGNAVTESDWNDVWLSEGFATYFTLLFVEHDEGRDAFVDGLRKSRATVFDFEKKNPALTVVHDDLKDMKLVTTALIYQKGAWTLHMLRALMGDSLFRAGIRDYYARYRDGNASTDDFRHAMEEHAGRDLGWFFGQWLRRAGSPMLDWRWRYDASAKRVEIEVTQMHPGEPYRLPLEFGLTADSTTAMRFEKGELTERTQRFYIAADRTPASVVLDPRTHLLADVHGRNW